LPDARPRRTRIALARSQPTEAGAKRSLRPRRLSGKSRDTGAPTGAVHLSYFIRDQLYPGIINRTAKHPGLKDGQVSRFLREYSG